MTFVRTDGFFGGWGSAPAAPGAPPPAIPITYDRHLAPLTPASLSGTTLADAEAADGWSVLATRTSGTDGSIGWDIPAGDLMDDDGVIAVMVEIDRLSASQQSFVAVQAGFAGDVASTGLIGHVFGRRPALATSAQGYLDSSIWSRSGATLTPVATSVFRNIGTSDGGEPAVALIVIDTAPDGTRTPATTIAVMQPIAPVNTARDILDFSGATIARRQLITYGAQNLARGLVMTDPDPYGGGGTRVATGDPLMRLYVGASGATTTAQVRALVLDPRADGLRTWSEANP